MHNEAATEGAIGHDSPTYVDVLGPHTLVAEPVLAACPWNKSPKAAVLGYLDDDAFSSTQFVLEPQGRAIWRRGLGVEGGKT